MQLLKYKKCSFIIVYVSMCWITFSLFISFIYQILTEKEVDMDIIKKSILLLFSHVWLFATPWTAADQASLSFTISWILLKFISIELMMPSSHLILCHPFLLMPSIFSSISLFLWVSSLNQIAKDGTSTLALVLPVDIQGWFPLGLTGLISLQSKTLSRIFSSTSLKALVLWRSAFFMVQLSHLYMITGKP